MAVRVMRENPIAAMHLDRAFRSMESLMSHLDKAVEALTYDDANIEETKMLSLFSQWKANFPLYLLTTKVAELAISPDKASDVGSTEGGVN